MYILSKGSGLYLETIESRLKLRNKPHHLIVKLCIYDYKKIHITCSNIFEIYILIKVGPMTKM